MAGLGCAKTVLAHIDASDAAHVQHVVESRGETIATEHLPKLFDRFYRAALSRDLSRDGVGLGLAIVGAPGGSLVTSADGVSRFKMRLPAPRP